MDLSALEADLIGDLWQDDHQLFEIIGFVRLHVGDDATLVREVTCDLLATWIRRGWLELVRHDGSAVDDNQARDFSDVLEFVKEARRLDCSFRGGETWIGLTDQARMDVDWLK
jgi:hypothetical protein